MKTKHILTQQNSVSFLLISNNDLFAFLILFNWKKKLLHTISDWNNLVIKMLFDIQHTLNEYYCMLTNQTVDWRYSCVQHSRTPVDSIFIRHTQVLIRTYHLKELVPKLYPAFHHHYHTHSVNCCKRWTRYPKKQSTPS